MGLEIQAARRIPVGGIKNISGSRNFLHGIDRSVGIKIQRFAASKNINRVIATEHNTQNSESRMIGAKTIAPIKPSTTLGTLAINSINGLNLALQLLLKNSLPKIAARIAIGAAINME